jgi:hypothetical protein
MHIREQGITSWIIIFVGLAMALFVLGFFRSERSFMGTLNYKTMLKLPCGVSIREPKEEGAKIVFPYTVSGYINGCGWEAQGAAAGTVQIFDRHGRALTGEVPLTIPSDSTEMPFFWKTTLSLESAPTTDSGSIVFRSISGLTKAIAVTF